MLCQIKQIFSGISGCIDVKESFVWDGVKSFTSCATSKCTHNCQINQPQV